MELYSVYFLIFITIFLFLYWGAAKGKLKFQNGLILGGSYLFYALWSWKFLFLLLFSSFLNYTLGLQIARNRDRKIRTLCVWIGVLYGILSLVYFKYSNFFITSFIDAFSFFGRQQDIHTLNIILPLGISFYTFKTISYILDVDKGKIQPVTDMLHFFVYVSYFPCITAGPIDRARTFIPELEKGKDFNSVLFFNGLKQILWGMFKKIVIADNCAYFTNIIFDNHSQFPSYWLLFGAFLYTIQLYTDFSGYADMAIGISKLLGITVTKNFNYPFFSQDIAHYWRNWHISLTSWLTEYVFTPLSIHFRDYRKWGIILATIINFIIVGVWHGANWTFILFGFLHGCYFIPLILNNKLKKENNRISEQKTINKIRKILGTFLLVMFTNIIFRANSISMAFAYFKEMLTRHFEFDIQSSHIGDDLKLDFHWKLLYLSILIICFFIAEWKGKAKECPLYSIPSNNGIIFRWSIYYALIILIFIFTTNQQKFIYSQF